MTKEKGTKKSSGLSVLPDYQNAGKFPTQAPKMPSSAPWWTEKPWTETVLWAATASTVPGSAQKREHSPLSTNKQALRLLGVRMNGTLGPLSIDPHTGKEFPEQNVAKLLGSTGHICPG